MRNILWLLLMVSTLSCQPSPPSKTTSAEAEILIGSVSSLTGSEATFGLSSKNGIDMMIAAANAAGGVHGKQLRVIVLDNQSRAEEAVLAATRLITQDDVVALLGELTSTRSKAMAPIAQSHKIPMLSPSATNPAVTEMGDYIFRACFIDPLQGRLMANFVFEKLKLKRAAVLKDIKNDYSLGLSQFFIDAYKKLGGAIIEVQSYSSGDIDFKAQLTAVRAKKPEFVFLPGYYTDVGLIVRQARELQIKVPFGGGDGWDSAKLFEIGGAAIDNCYFSTHYSTENKDPVLQKFIAAYRQQFGAVPDAYAALGYDAAGILVQAMKEAKSLSGPDLRTALAATKDFPGVTGKITFDAKRNPIKAAAILRTEKGAAHLVTMMNP